MKASNDDITMRGAAAGSAARACLLAAALLLAGAASSAQDAASAASDDEMFGSEETVTQANNVSKEAAGQSDFLKYEQVKIGGSLTGKLGYTAAWPAAWDGSAEFFLPATYYVSPLLQGKVTLVAKPSTDFGVNMDFRTSWPFQSTFTDADNNSFSVPNISVWSLYSKFNWRDQVYFSFGKQPLSWGVSKGYFQPADDIFALSATIDPTDTGAEREGPVSLKTTIPMGVTNNFYFFAGLPADSGGSSKVDPADARYAVKGEFSFGNTELALGAYYAYNDHPRALVMATTGVGSWNFFGEGVLKYGSERYFVSGPATAAQESGQFYFTGTAGGYYTNPDANLTLSLAYMFNGEAMDGVDYVDAFTYFLANPTQLDRSRFGAHYAFASVSRSDIFPSILGTDKLAATLIAIANLSDLSGYLMPSLTWSLFDYMSLQLGATFNFGPSGSEYIVYGVGAASGMSVPDKPGASLNVTLTVGTGDF
jgi:hypothetical protein